MHTCDLKRVSIRVKTLSNTNAVENASFPASVRRSRTPVLIISVVLIGATNHYVLYLVTKSYDRT